MQETINKQQRFIGVIDQSTTASKFSVFNELGQQVQNVNIPHEQITRQSGWLEHDPIEIIKNVNEAIEKTLQIHGSSVECIGVTNQRETILAWNKNTGQPYYNAIVWCDGRAQDICSNMLQQFNNEINHFKDKTGLLIFPYFSAFKIKWLLQNVPQIKKDMENVMFGNIDTWVIWNLTGKYYTDVSNASRTFLMNIHTCQWDQELLDLFEIPLTCLPEIKASSDDFGVIQTGPLKGVQICSDLGDQQSASLGHGNFKVGEMKTTYEKGF